MADDDDGKRKKGIDISKLAEISDSHLTAAARLAQGVERLNPALSTLAKIHEASALSALTKSIDLTGISAAQRAIDASGIGAVSRVMRDMDLAGVGALAQLTKGIDFERINAASRQMLDMDAIGGGAFAKLARGIDIGLFPNAIRVMEIPGLQRVLSAMDTGGIGHAIADANRSFNLGLPSAFWPDLQVTVGGLTNQMDAIGKIGLAHQSAFESLGLSNLESLLAKSLAVHEALLNEQKQATLDAQAEAKFHRRLVVVLAIINIIMFLMTVVSTIEDRMTGEDAVMEANTAALVEMREAFDAMASEMEATRNAQEAERQSEADAGIVGILRDIADVLTERAEPEE